MPDAKTDRLPLLDALRASAVLGVIAIHVLAGPLLHPSRYTLAELRWLVLLDALARCSVPLLIVISGLLLMRGQLARPRPSGEFLRRRLVRVLPAYLLWSLVYTLTGDHSGYLRHLLFGDASFHTWFVPLIVHLYVLFLLLIPLVRRCPPLPLAAAAVLCALLWPWLPLALPAGLLPALEQYLRAGPLAALWWLPYLLLGMALARPLPTMPRWLRLVGGVAGAGLFAVLVEQRAGGLRLSGDGDHARQQFLFGWQTVATPVFALMTSWAAVALLQRPGAAGLVQRLARLAPATYGVYLAHVLVLQLVARWLPYAMLAYFAQTVPLAVLVVAALSWLLVSAAGRVPYLRLAAGVETVSAGRG